jgi:hypothetical protein
MTNERNWSDQAEVILLLIEYMKAIFTNISLPVCVARFGARKYKSGYFHFQTFSRRHHRVVASVSMHPHSPGPTLSGRLHG